MNWVIGDESNSRETKKKAEFNLATVLFCFVFLFALSVCASLALFLCMLRVLAGWDGWTKKRTNYVHCPFFQLLNKLNVWNCGSFIFSSLFFFSRFCSPLKWLGRANRYTEPWQYHVSYKLSKHAICHARIDQNVPYFLKEHSNTHAFVCVYKLHKPNRSRILQFKTVWSFFMLCFVVQLNKLKCDVFMMNTRFDQSKVFACTHLF